MVTISNVITNPSMRPANAGAGVEESSDVFEEHKSKMGEYKQAYEKAVVAYEVVQKTKGNITEEFLGQSASGTNFTPSQKRGIIGYVEDIQGAMESMQPDVDIIKCAGTLQQLGDQSYKGPFFDVAIAIHQIALEALEEISSIVARIS